MKEINKIALISDLHLDFWQRYYYQKTLTPIVDDLLLQILDKCFAANPDIVVLAGDIINGPYTFPTMIANHSVPIYFVPGNHDFYGLSLPDSHQTIVDENIVLSTLWTNFSGDAGKEIFIYSLISDHRAIKNTSAYKVQNLCEQSFNAIIGSNKEIVVTHFPPSRLSVDLSRFRDDPLNSYFTNDFDLELHSRDHNIKLWMCGHVHHAHHYHIGDTLVACNPLGYPNERFKSISSYQPMILVKDSGVWKVER